MDIKNIGLIQPDILKTLIVEKEEDFSHLLKKCLKKEKCNVLIVNNKESIYQILKNENYDICFLSLNIFNRMNYNVLKEIRELNKNMSIVTISETINLSEMISMIRLGVDDYIKKPIGLNELEMTIDNVLKKQKEKLKNIKYKFYLEDQLKQKINYDIIKIFLNILEVKTPYIKRHVQNVAVISFEIGKIIGFNNRQLKELIIGAILHDIGKIGVSERILKKRTKLTKKEFINIKKHPLIGYNIIKNIKLLKNILPYILLHHERYDGKGYPKGLQGERIPLECRILSLADAIEAMSANRPYRRRLSIEKINREILYNKGTQFDPEIVNVFLKYWGKNKLRNLYKKILNFRCFKVIYDYLYKC